MPDISSYETRVRVLGALPSWQFNGRVAVNAGGDGFNARLHWSQQRDHFTATLSGPLGIGTVRIEGDDNHATLTDEDGTQTPLADIERDLAGRYGWTIPVSSLRYWALGIADPAESARTEFAASGLLQSLQQAGWRVSFTQYKDVAGQAMPALITASNPDTRVRLVIDGWRFPVLLQ